MEKRLDDCEGLVIEAREYYQQYVCSALERKEGASVATGVISDC